MNSLIPSKKTKLEHTRFLHNYACSDDLRRVVLQIVKQSLASNSNLSISDINDIKEGAIFLQLVNTFSKAPIEEKKDQSDFKSVCDYLNGLSLQDLTKTVNLASCEDGEIEELLKLLICLLFAFYQNESQSQKPRQALNEREALINPPSSETGNKSPRKSTISISRIVRSLSSSDQAVIRDAFEMAKEGKLQELVDILKETNPGSSKGTIEYLSSPNQNVKSPRKTNAKSPSSLIMNLRKKEQVIKALRKERAEDEERISSLLKEKEEAHKEIKTLKKKAQDNEVIIKQFRLQSSNFNELEDLRTRLEALSKENEINQKKITELERFKQDNPILVTENQSLRDTMKILEEKYDKVESKVKNQEELNKVIQHLQEKTETLESELRQSQLQVTYEREQADELRNAVESYKEQLADTTVSNMDSSGELVSMVCSPFKGPTASDMQNLEEQINQLSSELSDQKTLRETEKMDFESQKEQIVSELKRVQSALEESISQNDALKKEKQLLDCEISTLSSKFVNVEEKANQLVLECDELVSKKLELESELNVIKNQLETYHTDFVSLKEEFGKVNSEREEMKSKIDVANLALMIKESAISQNHVEIDSLQSQIKITNDEMCELKNQLNLEKSTNNTHLINIEELKKTKTFLEELLSKTKADLEVTANALNESEKRDVQHHQAFSELQSCYDSLKTNFLGLETKSKQLENEATANKNTYNTEVEYLNQLIKSLEDDLREKEKAVASLVEERGGLLIEIRNLTLSENEIAKVRANLDDCVENIVSLTEKNTILQAENVFLTSSIGDLKEGNMQLERNNEELRKESAEDQTKICLMQSEIEFYRNGVMRLVNELFDKEDTVFIKEAEEKDSVNELLKKLKLLKEERDSLIIEKNTLKDENEYLVKELEVTKESFEDKDIEASLKGRELESSQLRMAELTKDLQVSNEIEEQLLERLRILKSEEQALSDKLGKSLKDIDDYIEKVRLLEQEISEDKKKIDKYELELKNKDEELSTLISESNIEKNRETDLTAEIQSLKCERSELEILLDVLRLENERKTHLIHSEKLNYSALLNMKDELQAEKNKLEGEIQQQNREKEELHLLVNKKDEEILALDKELQVSKDKFEEEKKNLQQVNVYLKTKLENASHSCSSLEYIHQVLNKDYQKLVTKYQSLMNDEGETSKLKDRIEALTAKLDAKQLELNSLSLRLQQSQMDNDVVVQQLNSTMAQLEEEREKFQSLSNEFQENMVEERKELYTKIDFLNKERKEIETEKKIFREQLLATQSELTELKDKMSSFEALKVQVFNLQDENASQKLAYDDLEKDKNQLSIENFNLRETNSFLNKSLNDVKARNEKIESELKEKQVLAKKLEESHREYAKLQEQYDSEIKNLEELKADRDQRISELTEKCNLVTEAKNNIVKDLIESRQIQEKLNETHSLEVTRLEEKLFSREQSLNKKEAQLEEHVESFMKEKDSLLKQLQESRKECEKLLKDLACEQKQTELKEIRQPETKEAHTLKMKHLEERVSALQRSYEASQNKIHSLKSTQNNLILQKNKLTEEVDNLTKEKVKLAEEKDGLHKEWSQRFHKLSSKNEEVVEDNRKLAQRVVNIKKECQTHKERILQLGKLLDDSQKKRLEEMNLTYEKLDKRDRETAAEITKLKQKCQIAEDSFDEASRRLTKCKKLLEEKSELCDKQGEEINHLKLEIVKLKNQMSDLEVKQSNRVLSTQVEEYRRRFSCLPNVDVKSELPDYPSLSTRSRKQLDASMLSPGNNSSVIRFQCEEEEGHFNDHSKNLSNLKAGICETDSDSSRLLELQRRNTLCAPHQRTAYPVETQAWSSRKDPTKAVNSKNFDLAKNSQTETSVASNSPQTLKRRSPRFSSVAFEIKNDVAPKQKRKQINTDIEVAESPDKRTRANQWSRNMSNNSQLKYTASPSSKKRSWKVPLKEFFSPVTPNKSKKFKVPRSKADNQ